jgi:hypothetical protein
MSGQTDERSGRMELPAEVITHLNDLGFALLDGQDLHYTFARAAIGSEVHLSLEPVRQDKWRVGVKWRQPADMGRVPAPLIAMSLSRLGDSVDGETIDLSTAEVIADLPHLLARSVLPLVDLAPD